MKEEEEGDEEAPVRNSKEGNCGGEGVKLNKRKERGAQRGRGERRKERWSKTDGRMEEKVMGKGGKS